MKTIATGGNNRSSGVHPARQQVLTGGEGSVQDVGNRVATLLLRSIVPAKVVELLS